MQAIDARAVRSRNALLEAGIQTLLVNPQASLSDIAIQAGVGRATLYRHFETRQSLVIALAELCLDETDEACKPIKLGRLQGRAALEKMFHLIMPLADRFHFLLTLWNEVDCDERLAAAYNSQLDQLKLTIQQGKAEGSISSKLADSWLVCVFDSLIYSGWFCMNNDGMSVEQAADHAIQVFFDGVSQ